VQSPRIAWLSLPGGLVETLCPTQHETWKTCLPRPNPEGLHRSGDFGLEGQWTETSGDRPPSLWPSPSTQEARNPNCHLHARRSGAFLRGLSGDPAVLAGSPIGPSNSPIAPCTPVQIRVPPPTHCSAEPSVDSTLDRERVVVGRRPTAPAVTTRPTLPWAATRRSAVATQRSCQGDMRYVPPHS